MAQKQTTHDAVSAAMSAIEEALSLSADESPVGGLRPRPPIPAPPPPPDPDLGWPSPAVPPTLAPPRRRCRRKTPASPRRSPIASRRNAGRANAYSRRDAARQR